MSLLYILPILTFLTTVTCAERLVFVVVMVRHGARNMESLKYSAIINDTDFLQNLGRLTPVGKHQLYLLGRQLAYNYINKKNFISDTYLPHEIVIQSSGLNRTIESVQSFWSGFYQPGTGPVLSIDLLKDAKPGINVRDFSNISKKIGLAALPYNMQPVAIHTANEKGDYLFNAHSECTAGKKDDENYKKEFNELNEKYSPVYKDISTKYKVTIASLMDAYQLTDAIIAAKGNAISFKIPFKDSDVQKLIEVTEDESWNMFLRSELKIKLISHGLLFNSMNYLTKAVEEDKSKKKDRLKMAYFQISDAHISAMSKLLDFDIRNIVPFASNIIFELVKSEERYKIKVLFNNKSIAWNGQTLIDYEEFAKELATHTYKNETQFMDYCLNYHIKEIPETNLAGGIIILSILVLALIGVALMLIFKDKIDELNLEETQKKLSDDANALTELKMENAAAMRESENEINASVLDNPDSSLEANGSE